MSGMRDLSRLVEAGVLSQESADALAPVVRRYALAITPYLLSLLAGRDADDPLVRQFVPNPEESRTDAEEIPDPIGDHAHEPVKGVVHRYPDRVLLKPIHACAVYCRFCFRRAMVGPGGEALDEAELAAALAYIGAHPEIAEVVFSGGDPLLLSSRRLREIVAALAAMPHVGVLRVHTRLPVVDPDRITDELVQILATAGPAAWVAIHVNHADEFSPEAKQAIARLADAGIPLLGQTVLLKGVNDNETILENLFRAMVRNRIKPYYLHHTDLAPGTAHFRTSIERGRDLVDHLRGRVSGLCQPTYVLDIPGGYGKAPAARSWIETTDDGCTVRDYHGQVHRYRG